mmetsp:Transcript_45573/g.117796  ORF Transcript_45573/g.117796 Transcript_45573/m.117796 type:complete len:1023 (-) Transcript_45573:1984-5052(-)
MSQKLQGERADEAVPDDRSSRTESDTTDEEPTAFTEDISPDVKQAQVYTAIFASDKVLALGTSVGSVLVMDYDGNIVREFPSAHKSEVHFVAVDSTDEFVSSGGSEGVVVVHTLYGRASESMRVSIAPGIAVLSFAFDPSFSKKSAKPFLAGTAGGDLFQYKKAFFGSKGSLAKLITGEGAVWKVLWRDTIVAFASEKAVKVLDIQSGEKISSLSRPSDAPPSFIAQPSIAWGQGSKSILVSWGVCVYVLEIVSVNKNETLEHVRRCHALASFKLPNPISAISRCSDMIVVMSQTFADSKPKAKVSSDSVLVAVDVLALNMKGEETMRARVASSTGTDDVLQNKYTITSAPDGSYVFFIRDASVLRVKERNQTDRCRWLLAEGKLRKAEALVVELWHRASSNLSTEEHSRHDDWSSISSRDLYEFACILLLKLLEAKKYGRVIDLLPTFCGDTEKRWEKWISVITSQHEDMLPLIIDEAFPSRLAKSRTPTILMHLGIAEVKRKRKSSRLSVKLRQWDNVKLGDMISPELMLALLEFVVRQHPRRLPRVLGALGEKFSFWNVFEQSLQNHISKGGKHFLSTEIGKIVALSMAFVAELVFKAADAATLYLQHGAINECYKVLSAFLRTYTVTDGHKELVSHDVERRRQLVSFVRQHFLTLFRWEPSSSIILYCQMILSCPPPVFSDTSAAPTVSLDSRRKNEEQNDEWRVSIEAIEDPYAKHLVLKTLFVATTRAQLNLKRQASESDGEGVEENRTVERDLNKMLANFNSDDFSWLPRPHFAGLPAEWEDSLVYSFAEHEPLFLLSFLQTSGRYSVSAAFDATKNALEKSKRLRSDRSYPGLHENDADALIDEWIAPHTAILHAKVFALERMGNRMDAVDSYLLDSVPQEEGVSLAIRYLKEHNRKARNESIEDGNDNAKTADTDGDELWNRIIQFCLDRPRLLPSLLRELGTASEHVNIGKVVRQLPSGVFHGFRETFCELFRGLDATLRLRKGAAVIASNDIAQVCLAGTAPVSLFSSLSA